MASRSAGISGTGATGRVRWVWRQFRWQLTATAAVAAVALGLIGIGQLDPDISIPDRLYGTIELFSFSFGVTTGRHLPVTLEVARFLAPLTVAYAGFQAIAAIFVQQWTEFRVQVLFRDHVVVCGLGRTGLRFAITFRARGMKVVAIERNPSATAVEECRNRGIPLLTGDATDRLTLTKARSPQARYLIAACGDDGANGDVALLVESEAATRTRRLECFVHISDDRLCALLEEASLLSRANDMTRIEYFNVFRIGPRALLNTFGLTMAAGGPPQCVVVGGGDFARSLVVEAARRWHLDPERTGAMEITLAAPDAEAQIAAIHSQYPALSKSCVLGASPGDLSDPHCPELTPVASSRGAMVAFVCLEDDAAGLRAAIRARRSLHRDVPVVVCTTNRASSVTELLSEAGSNLLPNVWSFEVLERVCTPEVLLDSMSEAMAQAFHASYVKNELARGGDPAGASVRPWGELAETFRRSNRDLAFDIGPKLRRVDCAIEARTDWDTPVFTFSDDEVELLAELEHERWSTDRLRDGWRLGTVKDARAKTHPDLVPWNRLSEEIKEKDREAVRLVPLLLATYAGFAIVRHRDVPSGPAASHGGVVTR